MHTSQFKLAYQDRSLLGNQKILTVNMHHNPIYLPTALYQIIKIYETNTNYYCFLLEINEIHIISLLTIIQRDHSSSLCLTDKYY